MSIRLGSAAPIEKVDISVYTLPTDLPESDGTIKWDRTTIVIVEPEAGGVRGLGYTYADAATARVIRELLVDIVTGCDALAVPAAWAAMTAAVRNLGRPGIAAMAVSAMD